MSAIKPIDLLPTVNSTYQDWISYHESLKDHYGKNDAKIVFTRTWSERGTSDANTSELREYLESEGIEIDAGFVGGAFDGMLGVGDFISSKFKLGSTIFFVTLVVVIAIVVFALYNVAKDPNKTAGTVMSMRTGGLK